MSAIFKRKRDVEILLEGKAVDRDGLNRCAVRSWTCYSIITINNTLMVKIS